MTTQPHHQSVSGIRSETVVAISWQEFQANWRCAARLAEIEGLPGVAERLRYDVERMADVFGIDDPHGPAGGTVLEVRTRAST